MGTWVAVKVEFEADEDQLDVLRAAAGADATAGPGLNALVKIVEVRP